jgi:MHS family citrate/tricarballylate:H+ symporter-like MFS transporter
LRPAIERLSDDRSVVSRKISTAVAWLTGVTGGPLDPAWYMLAAAPPGLLAMSLVREAAPTRIAAA